MCDHHHHDESSETAAARLLERRGFLKAGVAAGLVAVITMGLTMTLAAPAKADRILLQFLGEAPDIGGLQDANDVAGTAVTEADVEQAIGEMLPEDSMDFLGCHELPLLDPATKVVLGTGIDCLWDITGGVVAVSFFVLPGGSLVNAGLTSLGNFTASVGDNPVVPGDSNSPPPILITGSIPNLTNDSIIAATGDFAGLVGTGRVSGAVANDGNFWFNCLWELNLQPNPGFANAIAKSNNQN